MSKKFKHVSVAIIKSMPEITVSHWPFSEQIPILNDHLVNCSVERLTSSRSKNRNHSKALPTQSKVTIYHCQIMNDMNKTQSGYNQCHAKISYSVSGRDHMIMCKVLILWCTH